MSRTWFSLMPLKGPMQPPFRSQSSRGENQARGCGDRVICALYSHLCCTKEQRCCASLVTQLPQAGPAELVHQSISPRDPVEGITRHTLLLAAPWTAEATSTLQQKQLGQTQHPSCPVPCVSRFCPCQVPSCQTWALAHLVRTSPPHPPGCLQSREEGTGRTSLPCPESKRAAEVLLIRD